MKKKMALMGIMIWALAAGAARSQQAFLGFEGGINLPNLNGPEGGSILGRRLGILAGGFLHVFLLPGLALQPELLYAQKNAMSFDGKIAYQLNYVEIPFLALVSLGLKGIDPGILLGPSLSANMVMNGLSGVDGVDLGLIGGTQVHFDPMLLSARYEMGLTNPSSDRNMQNGLFTFLVGVEFI